MYIDRLTDISINRASPTGRVIVLGSLSMTLYLLLSTGSFQEDPSPPGVKNQNKQKRLGSMYPIVISTCTDLVSLLNVGVGASVYSETILVKYLAEMVTR